MMQIVCIGISHHSAPLEFRERFAISESQLGTAARALAQMPGVREAVIVSTCNRVEFYLSADEPGRARDAVEHFFQARAVAGSAELFSQIGTHQGISHLFRVVCGLESMVLGETEILGQVKKAYRLAQESGATARLLNKLFQRAFHVAKEVRTETNITRGPVSVGSVAVDLAERIFGRLADCNVMILGAGETSELTARALQLRGVQTIIVANRSYERAAELAAEMHGRAIHFEEWERNAHQVDILIGSTAAPHHVLSAQQLKPIMHSRPDRPLFCIDLAVPRDIEPAVNELDGVYLYDIDSLQAIADETLDIRRQELARCEEIIERHVSDFGTWLETDSQRAARENGGIERAEPQPSKS